MRIAVVILISALTLTESFIFFRKSKREVKESRGSKVKASDSEQEARDPGNEVKQLFEVFNQKLKSRNILTYYHA